MGASENGGLVGVFGADGEGGVIIDIHENGSGTATTSGKNGKLNLKENHQ